MSEYDFAAHSGAHYMVLDIDACKLRLYDKRTSTKAIDAFSHLYKKVCPSVCPSVRNTRVEFLRNGLNLNKIASETKK